MSAKTTRIVFMGTPEFAVPSLDALIRAGYPIAGVISAPDKRAGRGLQMTLPPVKRFAEDRGIPVHQPDSLKEEYFIEDLQALQGDLFVVVEVKTPTDLTARQRELLKEFARLETERKKSAFAFWGGTT